ncbi:MAG: 4-hydroxybenzoate octaprenyltransferase [Hyphomicrobiales bacterium]
MNSGNHIADATPGNWVERTLPAPTLPYAQLMRLDRPIGWWLLLIPCWWGLALAMMVDAPRWLDLWFALLFLLGAIVMRGAGCVINDIFDRDFDAQVARTRLRPLPSGRVSVKGALVFLAVLLALGLLVLLQFNWLTVFTGLASALIFTIYPLMKRITYWPQLVLGIAFNWGALVGWTAHAGSLSLAPLLLYAGGISWTLAYDTIYAHQDKDDDILIGVKSTALKFGAKTRHWLAGFFALALASIAVAAWLAGGSWGSAAALAIAAVHAQWQCRKFDDSNSALCLALFKSNRIFGLVVLGGFVMDAFLT